MPDARLRRIPCPKCNGENTRKLNGALTISETLHQQRYFCQDCGTKFLSTWECIGIRVYEARPIKKLLEAGA